MDPQTGPPIVRTTPARLRPSRSRRPGGSWQPHPFLRGLLGGAAALAAAGTPLLAPSAAVADGPQPLAGWMAEMSAAQTAPPPATATAPAVTLPLPVPDAARGPVAEAARASADQTDLFGRMLASPERSVRRYAVRCLHALPHDGPRAAALGGAVRRAAESDGDVVTRRQAQLLLADWADPPAEPRIRATAWQVPEAPAADLEENYPAMDSVAGDGVGPDLRMFGDPAGDPVGGGRVFGPGADAATGPYPDAAAGGTPFAGGPAAGGAFAETPGDAVDDLLYGGEDGIRPDVLGRPLEPFTEAELPPPLVDPGTLRLPVQATPGFAGPSGIPSTDVQTDSHFVPMDDRWRSGMPHWDRYGLGSSPVKDVPYEEGELWNPYAQNVLKGDYPIIGQHTFLRLQGEAILINEYRRLPTPTTPFESTANPGQFQFFGDPDQYFTTNFFILRADIAHGNTAFKPDDWKIRLAPVLNLNYLDTEELGIVSPDVRAGTTRYDHYEALQEYFLEYKLADLSALYDFASVRAGNQLFVSDFRGHIFADVNRGVRLFGTRNANRDQFNLIYFDMVEKDTNSQLNTFNDRHQNVLIANYFRQDFVRPGYTAQVSYHYNNDAPSRRFNQNGFLVRPDPAGVFEPHRVETHYLGFAGEGHIGKINVSNAYYFVTGRDSKNPIGGEEQDIDAHMFALELSVDRDWIRFRTSFFYASGDEDPNDGRATGFDGIAENPNFAGGEFSYFQRQGIPLFGVFLTQRLSLFNDLSADKLQGQANHVNPGLWLVGAGMDFEITPKLRVITNANYLLFDETAVLETFTFQDDIEREIGLDVSVGFEYRPLHQRQHHLRGRVRGPDPGLRVQGPVRQCRPVRPGPPRRDRHRDAQQPVPDLGVRLLGRGRRRSGRRRSGRLRSGRRRSGRRRSARPGSRLRRSGLRGSDRECYNPPVRPDRGARAPRACGAADPATPRIRPHPRQDAGSPPRKGRRCSAHNPRSPRPPDGRTVSRAVRPAAARRS